jgi:cob(I)alamin adenosyltransferase
MVIPLRNLTTIIEQARVRIKVYNLRMPEYFSGKGDDGYTSLLGPDKVPKYDLRPETYGTLDEASAALGLSRALAQSQRTVEIIIAVQRDLYYIMAEVAALPEDADKFGRLGEDRLMWIESEINTIGDQVEMPAGFVVSGDSRSGAAIDLARTVIRRAERLVARMAHEGLIRNPIILPYVNRVSSLCFILALWENKHSGADHPTLAKGGRS